MNGRLRECCVHMFHMVPPFARRMFRAVPFRHARGQGLLEAIIALGIIVVSLLATVGLIAATLGAASVSKSQLLAVNLAREGIEVVRSIRDANWLALDSGDASVQWNDGLAEVADYTAIPVFTPQDAVLSNSEKGTWTLDFVPNENSTASDATRVWRAQSSDTYLQRTNTGELGLILDATNYWRLLTLLPLCWDMSKPDPEQTETKVAADGATCPAGFTQVGVEASVSVRWQDRGKFHELTLVERMYDWKT